MSNITRAAGIIRHMVKIENPTHDQDIAQELADAGLLAPAQQIIRTPAELSALDPGTVVLDGIGEIFPVRDYLDADEYEKLIYERHLPAVEVSTGSHYRACREALEGETT